MLYFGQYACYNNYYAFGNSREDVKKLLWRMFYRNCYDRPTKEDRETFEDEHYIKAVDLPTVKKSYGYNTVDGCDRIFTLSGNKLVVIKEVTE